MLRCRESKPFANRLIRSVLVSLVEISEISASVEEILVMYTLVVVVTVPL